MLRVLGALAWNVVHSAWTLTGEIQVSSTLGDLLVRSCIAVQAVLASFRSGNIKFPVDVDFGEGQSGDESPHSKVLLFGRA